MKEIDRTQDIQQKLDRAVLQHRITNRIRQSLELSEILKATAAEIRSFLGTNLVMVYRFYSDGSGEVIAESIDENRLPSMLGLNFPADDIPQQARDWFIQEKVH
jgi:light-regulated signal transduction histidine kinase (bacteriophytochrome)